MAYGGIKVIMLHQACVGSSPYSHPAKTSLESVLLVRERLRVLARLTHAIPLELPLPPVGNNQPYSHGQDPKGPSQ